MRVPEHAGSVWRNAAWRFVIFLGMGPLLAALRPAAEERDGRESQGRQFGR